MLNFFSDIWGLVPQSIKDATQVKIGQITSGTDIRPENLLTPEAQKRAQEKGKYVETKGQPIQPVQPQNFFADVKPIPKTGAPALVTADIAKQKTTGPDFDNKTYITPSSIAADIVQGTARTGAKIGLGLSDIYNKKTDPTALENDPNASKFEQNFFSTLFGQDKVEGLATDVASTELALQPYVGQRGSQTLAAPLIGGLVALDFMPGGKAAKTIGKELLEATTETAARDILKSTGLVGDVIEAYAPKFAKATTKGEVDNLLISLADNVDTLEKQGKVTEVIRIGSDGEPIKNATNSPVSLQVPEDVNKNINSAIEEAKKYKSAEEFVKAQGVPLLHGSKNEFKSFDFSKSGSNLSGYATKNKIVSLTDDINVAKHYGKNIVDAFINPSKIKEVENLPLGGENLDKIIEQAKQEGYSAISGYKSIGGSSNMETGSRVVFVFNENALKTKSQLTDIWNKAQSNTKIPSEQSLQKTLIPTENPYFKNWESFTPDRPQYAKLQERAVQFARDKGYEYIEIPGGGLMKAEKGLPAPESMKAIQEGIQNATNKAKYQQLAEEVKKEVDSSFLQKKTSLWQKFKDMMAPVKGLDDDTQKIYKDWTRKKLVAKETADRELQRVNIPNEQGLEVIHAYESGQVTPFSHAIETAFKDLKKEAESRGLEFGELKNYLPHVYDESPEEITKAISKYMQDKGLSAEEVANYVAGKTELTADQARRLKLNPSFVKDRTIPTYARAMEYGLTPKYTNPAQLISHYRKEMEISLANREFTEDLINAGKLKVLEALPKNTNWKAVDLPFSTKGYYAEPKLAKMLNGLYRDEVNLPFITEVAKYAGKASKLMQEIALSAGIPRTPFNFFTTGQLIKEITSGNLKAVMPYLRSYSSKSTREFLIENTGTMRKMAEQGIDLGSHIGGFEKAYENIAKKAWWKQIFGGELKKGTDGFFKAFDWAFNESTFSSFMPQLYIQTFKDAEKRAIAKGLADPSKFAGDVVRNAFGLVEDLGRSVNTKDAISAVFFAPQFRESLVNTLFNVGKSMTTQLFNPAFYKNRRLFAGMVISFATYNAINKKINGNYMWENEPGKEFDLKIPAGDGQYVYIPFMPSFLAFPRNMASGAYNFFKGNTDTALQKFGSVLSMPIKLTTELLSNQDYFGRPIYDKDDSILKKAEKIGLYLGLNANHPYIKEFVRQFITQPDKPIYQSISEALELPLKFGSQETISRNEFYARMDEIDAERKKARKALQPKFDEAQKLIEEDRADEARAIVDSLSDQEYEVYKDLKAIKKRKDTQTAKTKFYSQYRKIRDKVANGEMEEAKKMVDALSNDDYKYYKTLKDAGL